MGPEAEGPDYEERLTVLDTATRDVVAEETFPGPWWGAVLDPVADLLYVQVYGTRQLLVIDLATMTVAAEIDTGFATSALSLIPMALDPGAGRLYVSEFLGPLHVIDTTTLEAVASIPMGTGVAASVLDVVLDDVEGVAYVLKIHSGEIDVVDIATFDVVDTIEVGGAPDAGALDPSDGTLYVVDRVNDAVLVLERAG